MSEPPFPELQIRFRDGYLADFELSPPDAIGITTGKRLVLRQSEKPYDTEVQVTNNSGFIESSFEIPLTFSLIHDSCCVNDNLSMYHRRNWIAVATASDSMEEAVSRMSGIVSTFCGVASARGAGGLQHRLRRLYKITDGIASPVPRARIDFVFDVIDIDKLIQSVHSAFEDSQLQDPRLEKSAQYYSSGKIIYDLTVNDRGCQFNHHFASHQILASHLLFFKSCTAIVGDPATEKRFQSAYRDRGISRDTFSRILEIKLQRDKEDVAHSSEIRLDRGRSMEMAKHAREVASAVLIEYIQYLRSRE